jgi:hypothetical protein
MRYFNCKWPIENGKMEKILYETLNIKDDVGIRGK